MGLGMVAEEELAALLRCMALCRTLCPAVNGFSVSSGLANVECAERWVTSVRRGTCTTVRMSGST
jgi:hypothetical protein